MQHDVIGPRHPPPPREDDLCLGLGAGRPDVHFDIRSFKHTVPFSNPFWWFQPLTPLWVTLCGFNPLPLSEPFFVVSNAQNFP